MSALDFVYGLQAAKRWRKLRRAGVGKKEFTVDLFVLAILHIADNGIANAQGNKQ